MLRNLFLHFRPTTIPEPTLRFTLSWGLGGMAAVLVMLQFATGILLKFVYEPVPVSAYASILILQNEVPFGKLIRNLHYWGANLLVLTVFLHFLRVFFTGAFRPPRQVNWIVGLGLFALVLSANLTGYLLPWDQLAYWAVTICTGMLAYIPGIGAGLLAIIRPGDEIGPAALKLFFTCHTALIPAVFVGLMAFHFWRVRRGGGLVNPQSSAADIHADVSRVPTVPCLIVREAAVGLALIAGVMLLAVFFDAPLEGPANPGLSPNPTKAPWYFAGVQELMLHFHPLIAVVVIPVSGVLALALLPWISPGQTASGVWFISKNGRRTAGMAAAVAIIVIPILVFLDETLMKGSGRLLSFPPVAGVIIFCLTIVGLTGWFYLLRKRMATTESETVQAVFTLLFVSFAVLTIIDIWFRGASMALTWPWNGFSPRP